MGSINRTARRLALLVFLLIPVAAGIPLNHSASEHVGTTYNYSPAGPADLQVTLTHGSFRFDPKIVLQMALQVIAEQFLNEKWDSRLHERTETWGGPPGIRFLVKSIGLQFLERRFAVWALIRVVDHMVQNNCYLVTAADIRWQGVVVGRATTIPMLSTKKLEAMGLPNETAVGLSTKDVTRHAKIRLTTDDINMDSIKWFGRLYSTGEVTMGTLAAMVKIAERPSGNVQAFVGEWAGSPYSVFPVWWTTQRPSQLSKRDIFKVLVQATHDLTKADDFRCFRAILKRNGEYIGEGGYAVYPQLAGSGESPDIASEQ